MNTYSLEELAAGKFAALVSRRAARDHHDAARLLAVRIGLLKDPSFRIAWLIIMAGNREDARRVRASGLRLNVQEVGGVAPPTAEGLALDLERVVQPAIEELLRLLPEEREFLDALLDRGELRPELLTADESLRGRIAAQPMLRWKLRHTRQHLGLDLDSGHGRR